MIDLYTWGTPNGQKISIALEELGLPYTVHPINITKDEQFQPHFLKISPNNKIPAIVDREGGQTLMESGAILLYLAEKTGQLMPTDSATRWNAMQWIMWQMGGFGPMLGQAHHFFKFNPDKSDYARERYTGEAKRLYSVLNKQLEEHEYIIGDYSLADIAIWPWAARFAWHNVDLNDFPAVKRWYEQLAARPAVQKGYKVPNDQVEIPMP